MMKLFGFALVGLAVAFLAGCDDDDPGQSDTQIPVVTSFSPGTGTKGTLVTISGSGFTADTSRLRVFFNERVAQVITATTSAITAVVPSGAGYGRVSVRVDNAVGYGDFFDFIYTVTVTAFSGSVQGYADGPSSTARFNQPQGMAIDVNGNIMVADAGNNLIRIIFPNGSVNTFSGSGTAGHADGPPGGAQFNFPCDVTLDVITGEYYVADRDNHCIRKLSITGDVTTVAGVPGTQGYVDGAATAARLNSPTGIAWRGEQPEIYIADQLNHCIRKLDHFGILTTYAGTNSIGTSDGTGSGAKFNAPSDIYWDSSGFFYVSDVLNHNIRSINVNGSVVTIAGNGAAGFADGPWFAAAFNGPRGVVGNNGEVFLCDALNNRIRRIHNDAVETPAGTGAAGASNGDGSIATFDAPGGIVRDRNGNYYISDTNNHLIRKIVLD